MPIDQAAAVKAIQTDSKISEGLYEALGVDTKNLNKAIAQEATRGVASGLTYEDIARNIQNVSKAPLANANRIARTEGHRIQQASTMDAQTAAKAKGADVLKQWDSTMDGATRPTHRRLDGQICEVDEPFKMDGKKAMYPGGFGDPAEDCNCRCASLTRARWGLDEDELQTLKDRASFFGLDKTENFKDFERKYLKTASEPLEKSSKSSTMKVNKSVVKDAIASGKVSKTINRRTHHIHHASFNLCTHWHCYRLSKSNNLHSARKPRSSVHSNSAHSVITNVLLHLEDKFATIGRHNLECLIYCRQKNLAFALIGIKADINDSTYHLGYAPYLLRHISYSLNINQQRLALFLKIPAAVPHLK